MQPAVPPLATAVASVLAPASFTKSVMSMSFPYRNSPDTPVAAVQWGTRPEQRTVRATLGTIGTEKLGTPSVIVIGEVAGYDLSWYEKRPLFGRTIVVSRGLIDVLPDESSLAAMLAHELAHVALGHPLIDTKFAFADRLMVSDRDLLQTLQFQHAAHDEAAVDEKVVALLQSSPKDRRVIF